MSEISVPYLSENESYKSGTDGSQPGYRPSEEERKSIELVERLYSRAKKARKRYDQKWIDFYKMFRGQQWKEVRPSYRHSEVVNFVFQTIQSMVPVLTDSRPKLEYLPTVPSQFEISDILTKVAENDWLHNNWLEVLTEILFDSHFYGTAFGHCGYDEKANMGLGNILFESWDPSYCFPDPDARDINDRRSKFFIYAEPVALSKLKKDYPDKAQYLTADVIDLAQGDKSDIYQVMFKSPIDSKLILEGSSSYDSLQKDQTLKITCYFKDDEVEEIEDETDQANMIETSESNTGVPNGEPAPDKLKYPNGRKIVIAGGVLCEDNGIEFDDGLFPVCKLVNYILPREFWGMGEVEQLEGPQKTLNKLISFSLDVLTLMGNPIWIVDDTSGIDTDNLFNKPGLIVEKTAGSEVRRESGVELQPFVMELTDKFQKWIDGISGQTDLSRGAEPNDVTAASAISDLQEAQQTRLRLKSRNIDGFLQQFGKMYMNRVFQYYSVPRIVRISGDDNAGTFFHFHVEVLENDPATGQPFKDANGLPMPKKMAHVTQTNESGITESKQYEITGDFDVRVSTGSSLPFSKAEKSNNSFKLFQLGVIDDIELLKNLDYPNYEAVLQRVQQKKQAQAQQQMAMQAQAQAQGGKPQGPPPPPRPPGP